MTATQPRHCESCKSDISSDDILQRRAGLVAGVLLCNDCVEKKRQAILAEQQAAAQAPGTAAHAPPAAVPVATAALGRGEDLGTTTGGVYMPPVHDGVKDIADESLTLIADDETRVIGSTQIRSFSTTSTLASHHDESHFKRSLAGPDAPATRIRTFHGKLTEAGVAHMDEIINDWLDTHPDVFIKHSTSSIGMFEGKSKEPHLVLTLFY